VKTYEEEDENLLYAAVCERKSKEKSVMTITVAV
jgi:hypothetical protein